MSAPRGQTRYEFMKSRRRLVDHLSQCDRLYPGIPLAQILGEVLEGQNLATLSDEELHKLLLQKYSRKAASRP